MGRPTSNYHLQLPPASNQGTSQALPFSTRKLPHFPACLGVSAKGSNGADSLAIISSEKNSLCLFSFGWSSFIFALAKKTPLAELKI